MAPPVLADRRGLICLVGRSRRAIDFLCEPGRTTDMVDDHTIDPRPIRYAGQPEAQGLYDPRHEHDACGVGLLRAAKRSAPHAS